MAFLKSISSHFGLITALNLSLLLITFAFLISDHQLTSAEEEKKFPSLWDSVPNKDQSYHVVYQLEMGGAEQTLTIEEWAFYEMRLLRMDIIMNSVRTSYIIDGMSREIVRYKPFVCDQLDETGSGDFEILSKLFLGFRWDRSIKPLMAYGLGPLWLRVSEDKRDIKRMINVEGHEFSDEFDEFRIEMDPKLYGNQVPYKMLFFFPAGERHFVDSIDWLSQDDNKVVARLKVVQVDFTKPDETIFKLPIGYGCKRLPKNDHELNMDVGLVLLHKTSPNQAVFNIIFSQPQDDLLHTWMSFRYSMRVLRHSRARDDLPETESYFVSLIQSRSALLGAKLKRTKRVWWAPNSSEGKATLYEIDQLTGKCLVSHRDVRDQFFFGYIGGPALFANSNHKPAALSVDQISFLFAESEGYHLIDLGESLDQGEFRNRYYEKRVLNFKLKTGELSSWEGPVSIVKRISSYSKNARVGKNGDKEAQRRKLTLLSDYQTTVTIFFYSNNFESLLYKIVIELVGNHEVSHAYVHEQLDVSACFDSNGDEDTDSSQTITIKYPIENPALLKQLEDKQEDIKSALFMNLFEKPAPLWTANKSSPKDFGFLSPLQVTDVQLSFDLFYARLQMTILDLPLTQLFQLDSGFKLTLSDSKYNNSYALMQTIASSASLCADHCEHYNCMRFAYDLLTKECQVELIGNLVRATPSSDGQLYTYYDRMRRGLATRVDTTDRERPHLSASSIVEYFEQLVESSQQQTGNDDNNNGNNNNNDDGPLVLRVNMRPNLEFLNDDQKNRANIVVLRPESVHHELETIIEYARELNDEHAGAIAKAEDAVNEQMSEPDPSRREKVPVPKLDGVVTTSHSKRLRVQYFKHTENQYIAFGNKLAGQATFEECERHCDINDCRSFSYCNRDETCIISKSANGTMLGATVEAYPAQQCNIYSLDTLSKFENFGPVLRPTLSRFVLPGLPLRGCSNECMYLTRASCQGFFHCQIKKNLDPEEQPEMCYLISEHVTSLPNVVRREIFNTDRKQIDGWQANAECSFYSRSYLAQFDKYLGRSLEVDPKAVSGSSMTISSSTDANECASRCIELGCLAFDACISGQDQSGGRASTGKETCTLLFNGVKQSQFKPSKQCSAFVLSDKSQFNAKRMKVVQDSGDKTNGGDEALSPDQKASIGPGSAKPVGNEEMNPAIQGDVSASELELLQVLQEQQRSKFGELLDNYSNSSHWLARLFSFSLGTLCGCLFVVSWNEAYARGWLARAQSGAMGAAATVVNWRR